MKRKLVRNFISASTIVLIMMSNSMFLSGCSCAPKKEIEDGEEWYDKETGLRYRFFSEWEKNYRNVYADVYGRIISHQNSLTIRSEITFKNQIIPVVAITDVHDNYRGINCKQYCGEIFVPRSIIYLFDMSFYLITSSLKIFVPPTPTWIEYMERSWKEKNVKMWWHSSHLSYYFI